VKASACGNDFLLIEMGAVAAEANLAELTRRLCNRHNGIGADGVEWMSPHESADIEIRLINADGSEAEISGNGTRCVAAYICSSQGKEQIHIQTGAGLKTCILTGRNGSEYEFETGMGRAEVGAELLIQLKGEKVFGIPLSIGNPHYVMFSSEIESDWQVKAAEIQRDSGFKQGVNIEMVVVDGDHDVRAWFFERGAGETQSSGTGTCAAAVAAISAGKAMSPVRVHAPGGSQTVRVEDGVVFLRGPARLIGRGEFFLD
jgi:diaminopimelate epimerase